jgi:hypothetical protein
MIELKTAFGLGSMADVTKTLQGAGKAVELEAAEATAPPVISKMEELPKPAPAQPTAVPGTPAAMPGTAKVEAAPAAPAVTPAAPVAVPAAPVVPGMAKVEAAPGSAVATPAVPVASPGPPAAMPGMAKVEAAPGAPAAAPAPVAAPRAPVEMPGMAKVEAAPAAPGVAPAPEKSPQLVVKAPEAAKTPEKTTDYYGERAKDLLADEQKQAQRVHPLQQALPDHDVIVCEAGCGTGGPVVLSKQLKSAKQSANAAKGSPELARLTKGAECRGGCFETRTGIASSTISVGAQGAPGMLGAEAGQWLTTTVTGDAPDAAPPAGKPAAGKKGLREDWMARINRERSSGAEAPAPAMSLSAPPAAPKS